MNILRFIERRALKNPESSIPLIHRLFRENFHQFRGRYAIAFVFMGIIALTTSLSAWIMKDVINEVFVNKDMQSIWLISGAVMLIFIIKGLASYGQVVTMSRIGNAIVARVQRRLYDHLLKLGVDYYQKQPSSELITRMSHNAASAREVMNLIVTSLGRDLLSLIGLISVMIIQDPFLSFFALVIAPPAVISVGKLIKRVRKFAKEEFLSLAKVIAAMQETAQGIRIIKSFTMENRMRAVMGNAIEAVENRANKIAQIQARTSPLMETLGGLSIAAVILYSGLRITQSGQTPGEFMSFLTALLLAYEPAKRLARLHVNLEANLIGVRLMYEVLDETPRQQDNDGAPLHVTAGRVEIQDATFRYNDGKPVLNKLSLTAQAGETIALVGPSGGGKSTLINLIPRFYDLKEGKILIDGQDISTVSLESLRHSIALVSQDTFLFTGTIQDNIRFGAPQATDEEIKQAAIAAYAHDFILAQPDGYDTVIGENGMSLSGGQRQRVAIARALLKDAPIVLLDEATSALDSEAEHEIQKAFERLMQNRTTFVIAHRLSTVRNADKIFVLKEGQIVESGSHEALIQQGGLYSHLYKMQFSE
jgi:ATP-binding cassette, subfamily B, bacterial MsbA